ncbi:UNKNOWN [Stylonychia lemnae]|uniref:Transmembrane protein n=1 Tax=Stylonychia lemnae TaxID=5949 RepID=A0A078ANM6_STYLE|nr:UNKNOWN [Stylonychia lemnae]|eukprot:CDW83536.1 UNKNOWN [Stylonychia lemnae]
MIKTQATQPSSRYSTKQLQSYIKNLDSFGIPVSLTFKNDPHLKSFVGGAMTVLSRIGVFIYLALQMISVFSKTATIQASFYRRDLIKDPTQYDLTLKDFDYGIRLEYVFYEREPQIQAELDQYVYMQISQNIYTWVKDKKGNSVFQKQKIKTELGNCSQGRLGLKEGEVDYLGIINGYQCPKDVNYQIKGSFSGEQTKFIQLSVRDCNQTYLNEAYNKTKQCKSKKEIERVSANLKMYFVAENSYFDENDYGSESVKKFLKPYYLTSKNATSKYYYMLLSQNEIIKQDNLLLDEEVNDKFIETKIDYSVDQELEAIDAYNNAYIGVYIQMDDQVKTVNRKLMTILDALGNTGGFMSIIIVVAYAMIQYVQKTLYYTSLVKSLFVFQENFEQQSFQPYSQNKQKNVKIRLSTKKNLEEEVISFEEKSARNEEQDSSTEEINLFQKLYKQLSSRKKLKYTLTDEFKSTFIRLRICKKTSQEQVQKDILYKRGVDKIDHELDLRYIIKQLRSLKFISQVLLNKQQRFMLPYFKANLLNVQNAPEQNKKDKFGPYLRKTIENRDHTKIDRRILKYIDLSDEDLQHKAKINIGSDSALKQTNNQKISDKSLSSVEQNQWDQNSQVNLDTPLNISKQQLLSDSQKQHTQNSKRKLSSSKIDESLIGNSHIKEQNDIDEMILDIENDTPIYQNHSKKHNSLI